MDTSSYLFPSDWKRSSIPNSPDPDSPNRPLSITSGDSPNRPFSFSSGESLLPGSSSNSDTPSYVNVSRSSSFSPPSDWPWFSPSSAGGTSPTFQSTEDVIQSGALVPFGAHPNEHTGPMYMDDFHPDMSASVNTIQATPIVSSGDLPPISHEELDAPLRSTTLSPVVIPTTPGIISVLTSLDQPDDANAGFRSSPGISGKLQMLLDAVGLPPSERQMIPLSSSSGTPERLQQSLLPSSPSTPEQSQLTLRSAAAVSEHFQASPQPPREIRVVSPSEPPSTPARSMTSERLQASPHQIRVVPPSEPPSTPAHSQRQTSPAAYTDLQKLRELLTPDLINQLMSPQLLLPANTRTYLSGSTTPDAHDSDDSSAAALLSYSQLSEGAISSGEENILSRRTAGTRENPKSSHQGYRMTEYDSASFDTESKLHELMMDTRRKLSIRKPSVTIEEVEDEEAPPPSSIPRLTPHSADTRRDPQPPSSRSQMYDPDPFTSQSMFSTSAARPRRRTSRVTIEEEEDVDASTPPKSVPKPTSDSPDRWRKPPYPQPPRSVTFDPSMFSHMSSNGAIAGLKSRSRMSQVTVEEDEDIDAPPPKSVPKRTFHRAPVPSTSLRHEPSTSSLASSTADIRSTNPWNVGATTSRNSKQVNNGYLRAEPGWRRVAAPSQQLSPLQLSPWPTGQSSADRAPGAPGAPVNKSRDIWIPNPSYVPSPPGGAINAIPFEPFGTALDGTKGDGVGEVSAPPAVRDGARVQPQLSRKPSVNAWAQTDTVGENLEGSNKGKERAADPSPSPWGRSRSGPSQIRQESTDLPQQQTPFIAPVLTPSPPSNYAPLPAQPHWVRDNTPKIVHPPSYLHFVDPLPDVGDGVPYLPSPNQNGNLRGTPHGSVRFADPPVEYVPAAPVSGTGTRSSTDGFTQPLNANRVNHMTPASSQLDWIANTPMAPRLGRLSTPQVTPNAFNAWNPGSWNNGTRTMSSQCQYDLNTTPQQYGYGQSPWAAQYSTFPGFTNNMCPPSIPPRNTPLPNMLPNMPPTPQHPFPFWSWDNAQTGNYCYGIQPNPTPPVVLPSIPDAPPQPPAPKLNKHPEFWMEDISNDTTVWIRVGQVDYLLPARIFMRNSQYFRVIFGNHVHSDNQTGPIILPSIKNWEFECLLRVFYPSDDPSLDLTSKIQWEKVLEVMSFYDFSPRLKEHAFSKLDTMVSAADRVHIGRTYNKPSWIKRGLLELCNRDTPLTVEECRRIGPEDTVHITELLLTRNILVPQNWTEDQLTSAVVDKFGLEDYFIEGRGQDWRH